MVGSLRVLARLPVVPLCASARPAPSQSYSPGGRSLEPKAPNWPHRGRSPFPPPDEGERSAAGKSTGLTMAGLWVRTVALLAARRHWRRSSQQLLWTLKVSRAGLAWAWLPGVLRRHPRGIPAASGRGPEQAARTLHPATGHLLNAPTGVHRLKWAELLRPAFCAPPGWPSGLDPRVSRCWLLRQLSRQRF